MNIDHALRHLKDGGYESAACAVRNLARDHRTLEARVRELEAEVERLRSPYQAFTAERRVAELVAERDELRTAINSALDSFTLGKRSEVFDKLTAALRRPPDKELDE